MKSEVAHNPDILVQAKAQRQPAVSLRVFALFGDRLFLISDNLPSLEEAQAMARMYEATMPAAVFLASNTRHRHSGGLDELRKALGETGA
jgi:hypothetical protein